MDVMPTNARVWWVAACLTAVALSASTLYRLGYEHAKFELGTLACWPHKDHPDSQRTK
jgi:hypothetical protein